MKNHLITLLKKEWQLEMKNTTSIASVILYVLATVYVCYLTLQRIDNISYWSAIYWIILMFGFFNAAAKSFFYENKARQLYLYTLTSASTVILAKIIYNVLLNTIIASITLFFYILFIGQAPLAGANIPVFLCSLLLGSSAFAGVLTLLSAISAKTNGNFGLLAILGLPLVIPLLLTLNKVNTIALRGLGLNYAINSLIILLGLNILVAALSYVLFPYLWRE